MSRPDSLDIRQLNANDARLMEALLTTLGEAFDDVESNSSARPSPAYFRRLLSSDYFIAVVALNNASRLRHSSAVAARRSSA